MVMACGGATAERWRRLEDLGTRSGSNQLNPTLLRETGVEQSILACRIRYCFGGICWLLFTGKSNSPTEGIYFWKYITRAERIHGGIQPGGQEME